MRILVAVLLMSAVLFPRLSAAGCGSRGQARIDRQTFAVASDVDWRDLDRGRAEAREGRLPMLLHLSFGSQCEHCRELEHRVFSDPELLKSLNSGEYAVPVKIPLWAMTPAERAFAERLGYREDCFLALVRADGEVLKTASSQKSFMTHGLPDPEALLQVLHRTAQQ